MIANVVCEGEANLAMSMVMQRGRRAKGGLKWETVVQSGKDRNAGPMKQEASRIRIMQKRKSEIISSPQAKVVGCGRHVRRVWKWEAVQRVKDAEAGSDEQEILTHKEENDGGEDEVDEDDLCSSASAVKPLMKKETAQGIKEWRSRYVEHAAMERYITGQLSEEKNSPEPTLSSHPPSSPNSIHYITQLHILHYYSTATNY